MSYSTDPVADAARHTERLAAYNDRLQAAERSNIEDFTEACNRGNADALCLFAPMVRDETTSQDKDGKYLSWENRPMRYQPLYEVMASSLDCGDGPTIADAMQLILNASNGASVQEQADELIKRMSATWAKYNTEVE